MSDKAIDLNCDLGEGFGAYEVADDQALLKIVSSANIACGVHAGDPVVMDKTIREALKNKVAIGAHIGFPDREGFGRRMMKLSLKELELTTITQLGALSAIAQHHGARLTHANFHGALGNLAFTDNDVAETLISAMKAFDPALVFIGLPNTAAAHQAESQNVRLVKSFLADRGYSEAGVPVGRGQNGGVMHDSTAVARRICKLLETGKIETVNGDQIDMSVDSILIHSDTPNSVELAQKIHEAVDQCGYYVRSYQ
ncbi:5-oxoprolinase subunit PxpA [Ochrobactrum sp. Q0168]|uniref:LamB/YcsF family protein n=1 Tax=Ochrobactrum sp. Q0168 TaxID=2793241 RepID=UPI0018EBB966|nr:5-oxoprolinase subunit PxpA [Ochrobactrum sp. Q0168]